MGSPFNLVFYHFDSVQAVQFARECFALVDSLNDIYSDYNTESEIGRLANQTTLTDLKISDELYFMISKSKWAWKRSHKTFDITIGSVTHIWRNARRENRFPSKTEIKTAMASTGFRNISTDVFTKTISFKKPGMLFDFGGIVKGYTAQRVIDHLKMKNITIALADAGGDIALSDPPPGKKGWSVAINLPEQENEMWDNNLQLKNCAVATSGDIYRYTIHNGKKYSHIINPRTGYGVTSLRNVTVIAKDGATADWLATACSILPIRRAKRLVKKEKAALMIALLKDEKIITHKTKNFDSYFEKKQP